MHPAFHILISILIGLGMSIHHKHRYVIVIVLAFAVNCIIDVDYILFMRGIFSLRYFHTGLVMLYIPVLMILFVHLYEKGTGRSILTRIFLLVFLMSSSHLLLDTFSPEDGIYLNWPFSAAEYELNHALLPHAIGLIIVGVIVFNLLETYIYSRKEGSKKRAVRRISFPFIGHQRERRSQALRSKEDESEGDIYWKRAG